MPVHEIDEHHLQFVRHPEFEEEDVLSLPSPSPSFSNNMPVVLPLVVANSAALRHSSLRSNVRLYQSRTTSVV